MLYKISLRILAATSLLTVFSVSANAQQRYCHYNNAGCHSCVKQAFKQWKSIDCWSLDRSTEEQIKCSQDMSAWYDQYKSQCFAKYPNPAKKTSDRAPASTEETDEERLNQALGEVWDGIIKGGKKVGEACNDLKKRTKEFSKTVKDAAFKYFEIFKEECGAVLSN